MKKNDKTKKEQKPKGVTELTDQDLERAQGGQGKKWLPANG